jgi:hypothetical protein
MRDARILASDGSLQMAVSGVVAYMIWKPRL